MRKARHFLTLLLKALFPRLLFLGHGLMCIWIVAKQENNKKFWYLATCLGLLVLEGFYNAIVRHGKEFHWFCPSAFLYCVVLIVTVSFFREQQIQCILDNSLPDNNNKCAIKLQGSDVLTATLNKWSYEKRISIVEQTGMLVLIIGRWLLPSGSISREQFSQILLIYIGTAADIVEFNEIYSNEDSISDLKKKGDTSNVLHGVMAVWAWSVLQFSLTIALPEEGLKQEENESEADELEDISYFRRKIKTNKVAPMTYMHYKSMLREGFNTTTKKRHPSEAQEAFRKKYENVSNTLMSLKVHNGRVAGQPLSHGNKRSVASQGSSMQSASPQTVYRENKFSGGGERRKKSKWRSVFSGNGQVKRRKESIKEDNGLGIGRSELQSCFIKYLDLIGILLPVCMQDGPFFIFRFVLLTHYQVVTEMIILLTVKNALVVIVQIYRILIMYCSEPRKTELEVDEASLRVRNAMNSNDKLSSRLPANKVRASVALSALTRMHAFRSMQERHQNGTAYKQNHDNQNGAITESAEERDVSRDVSVDMN